MNGDDSTTYPREEASFLFLDEATSALDNTSEKMIQQSLGGKTDWASKQPGPERESSWMC